MSARLVKRFEKLGQTDLNPLFIESMNYEKSKSESIVPT